MDISRIGALLILATIAAPAAAQTVYRCKAGDGFAYQDRPCTAQTDAGTHSIRATPGGAAPPAVKELVNVCTPGLRGHALADRPLRTVQAPEPLQGHLAAGTACAYRVAGTDRCIGVGVTTIGADDPRRSRNAVHRVQRWLGRQYGQRVARSCMYDGSRLIALRDPPPPRSIT